MGAPGTPQILITIACRASTAFHGNTARSPYSLILKDVRRPAATLYLTATDMGLGGCAIGSTISTCFARMTGIQSTSKARSVNSRSAAA